MLLLHPESISSPEGLKSGETRPALLTVGCYYQSMRDFSFLSRSFPSSALCICANGFHMACGLSLTSSVCHTHTLSRKWKHVLTVKRNVSREIKQYADLMIWSLLFLSVKLGLQEKRCFSCLFWLLGNATGALGLAATSWR